MKELFVDTSGWMACADSGDAHHEGSVREKNSWLAAGGRLAMTDYIVDETLTLIRMRIGLEAAKKWWDAVSASARVRLVTVDGSDLEAAREIFFKFKDKGFSFTDCTSFAVMKKFRIRMALSTDRHFEQAGFRCLPKK